MFAKSRKEKLVDQAQDLAHDLSEAIAPHVEKARDELAPRLADARDAVSPRLNGARDAVAPRLADARDAVAPRLADARDTVAPHVESARDRIVSTVGPTVSSVVENAREQASTASEEALRRGSLAAAALKGEPVKKKGGKRKWLLVVVVAGIGAYAAKKLTSGSDADNWQSSYTPTPAPAAPPAPPSPSAPAGGAHVGDQQVDLGRVGGDDPAGASPGESIADSTEAPHAVTTPDSPVESVDVSDVEDPQQS